MNNEPLNSEDDFLVKAGHARTRTACKLLNRVLSRVSWDSCKLKNDLAGNEMAFDAEWAAREMKAAGFSWEEQC